MTSLEKAPAIPWPGLLTVLGSYSGKGQLFATLGALHGTDDSWSPLAVRRRARRILFEQVLPVLVHWPTTPAAWLDALPAQTTRHRQLSPSPAGRVDWAATRRMGWPPDLFATTRSNRLADAVLTTTLAWTVRRLLDVRADAVVVVPDLAKPAARQLDAARTALHVPPVAQAEPIRPGRPELAAVHSAGRPWSVLARVAELLAVEDTALDKLARLLLLPDDDLRWRLFHLGCLGTILTALRNCNCTIRSRRPLGIGTGPAYTVTTPHDGEWDLWFESAGIWTHYGIPAPYVEATRGLPGAGQPLGADIALIRRHHDALVIECKYSADPTYVGRDGYHQAATYLTEIRTKLTPRASAIVVGPEGVVTAPATTITACGSISVVPPGALMGLLPLGHPHN
jgi:hypothetical protein